MRHRRKIYKLGRRSAHLRAMLANQVSSLILYGQIETTLQKAKGTQQFVEKMVTYAKKGDLHHRRLAIAKIKNKEAVRILFSEIAPRFTDRKGGYTKILKLGQRRGDSAEKVILKWVSNISSVASTDAKKEEGKKGVIKNDNKA